MLRDCGPSSWQELVTAPRVHEQRSIGRDGKGVRHVAALDRQAAQDGAREVPCGTSAPARNR